MYIVIGGGGKVGEVLARHLLRAGHEVALIEQSRDRADRLSEFLSGRLMVVCGNCCDSETLRDAGIEYADIFCAVTGQDDNNLAACEVAQTLFNIPRAIARVNNPRNERIFNSLGIDAVSSTMVIARMIEENTASAQMRAVISLKQGEFAIMEVEIPDSSTLRADGGQRVSDLTLPPSTILIAVTRDEQFDVVNGQTVLEPHDTVLVCTKSEYEDDVRRILLEL